MIKDILVSLRDFLKEQKDVFIFIFFLSLVNTFVADKYMTPTDSMYPTIQRNEFKIGSKYDYGYGTYSISVPPFVPYIFNFNIFKGRLLDFNYPSRGDIISFYVPKKNILYTKRIIGLPGDEVEILHGKLIINGREVISKQKEDYLYRNKLYNQYNEILPNGVSYNVIFNTDLNNTDINLQSYNARRMMKIKVPENSYFVMGDNRDHSADSRSQLGCIKRDDIVAKLRFIIFSSEVALIPHDVTWSEAFIRCLNPINWVQWVKGIRFSRVFTSLY